jgi:Peptidase A4 family
MKRRIVTGIATVLACGLFGVASASAAGPASGRPITGKTRIRPHQSLSTNWSGYAAFDDTFTHVTGTWTEPTANCAGVKGQKETVAAFWAGLDGYTSSSVEQTGVDTICVGKTAYYLPWYEFYPARSVSIPETVNPGDTLTSDVSVSGGVVTTTLTDAGHWTYSAQTSAAGLPLSSAEWIAEAPTNLLTDFGTVHFSSASATDAAGHTGGIADGSWSDDAITMVSRNGRTVRAQPENLSTSGGASSFDDVWEHF